MRPPLSESNEAATRNYNFTEMSLRNTEVVQAMGMTEGLLRRWSTDRSRMMERQVNASDRAATVQSVIRFLRLSMQSLILGLGAYLVIERAATVGAMFAASILLGRALQPVEQIVGSWRNLVSARSAFSRIRDLLIALPLAIAGFLIAAGFGEYLARRSRRWFVPQPADLAAQSLYYVALNAPVEEWFFRGFLQGGLTGWLGSPLLAVVLVTAIFGGYHFLDRWGWRPVIGATAAGLALGLVYLWQPEPPSLLAPTLVHGAITCGFLSLGPYGLFRWRMARRKIEVKPHLVRE